MGLAAAGQGLREGVLAPGPWRVGRTNDPNSQCVWLTLHHDIRVREFVRAG